MPSDAIASRPAAEPAEAAELLLRRLGVDRVVVDPEIMDAYRRDHTAILSAGHPQAVVRAQSIDDVVTTMETATATGTPVVTRGAGTGLAGGANAIDGCIVLSTTAMDEIIELDVHRRIARVQCGTITANLASAAAEVGLWYPPDPSSRDISTIGGNIATNAGGACCLKYGVTGDHVGALTAVTADGSILRVGAATRKNVAGLDLTRLLVGSEGTLAVIVEATLRLRPMPEPPATLVASFATVAAAGQAVLQMARRDGPSLLELMDRPTIVAVEAMTRMGLDTDAGALLLVQTDGAARRQEIRRCAQACRRAGATYVASTSDPEEGALFLAARRAALPALERLGPTLLDDVAVPTPAVPAMLAAIAAIAERHGLTIATFGHAGDGNLHPTIVLPPGDDHTVAEAAFDEIVHACLALGGSITGEHGVGSLKSGYLTEMVGPLQRTLMARIKAAFDPMGILNPGKAI